VGKVLDDVPDPEPCFQELYRHFSRPGAWRCDPETGPVLQTLAGRYHLGLASNYDRRLRSVWEGLPELRECRQLIISSEIGWRKPAPQFFQALCREMSLPARQVLSVGDDPRNDYHGAIAANMPAILFDPRSEYASFTGKRIVRLRDLLVELELGSNSTCS
jgi:putative hydrolase of the HAD superfamily